MNFFKSFFSLHKKRTRQPFFEKWYGFIFVLIAAFAAADLFTLYTRQMFLPVKTPTPPAPLAQLPRIPSKDMFDSIVVRNPFSSQGVIPDALTAGNAETQVAGADATPVKSQLPMTLVGTIVHVNPARSVATIELKGRSGVNSFIKNESIEGLATLVSVERRKAIIRNSNNQRLEYIEIPIDDKIKFGSAKGNLGSNDVVQKQDEGNFSLSRQTLNELAADLPNILQQARAVPNIGANGEINGFRILDIQPGSIYEKLGIQRNDVIQTVNGDPVDSPGKAMEMWNTLRNSPNVAIGVLRNGRNQTINYNIK